MALGQHRMEDAAHPDGGGKCRLVRQQLRAAAQDVAVRALHAAFFFGQHDMGLRVREERQQRPVDTLLMPPRGAEQGVERGGIEIAGNEQWGTAEQAGRRLGARPLLHRCRRCWRCWRCWPSRQRQRQRGIDAREVIRRGGGRVIGQHAAEEAQRGLLAGRKCQRRILDRQQRVLVLQPLLAQIGRHVAQLQAIRREADAAPQRAHQRPGVAALLGQVLPRRQHGAHLRVHQRAEIEVVADVILVDARRGVGREADVLHADEIQRQRLRRQIAHLQVPEPDRLIGCQTQRQLDAQPRPFTDRQAG